MAHTIPLEGPYTEVERHFIESSPDGLWPDNQDSVFGQVRKCLTDICQEQVDETTILNDETFTNTSSRYLSLWEEMLGLSVAPSGWADAKRRSVIASRQRHGLYTRDRRRSIVEDALLATFGDSLSLTSAGLPLSAGGSPLYSGVFSLVGLYRIYDNISNFSYVVRILNTSSPDIGALNRELTRITPAHISYTIDNTPTNVLKWDLAVQDLGSSGWWRLAADYLDYSGLGHNGTVVGAPAAIAAPGLNLAPAGTDAARDFSGGAQYVTIPYSVRLDAPQFTMMGIVRPDNLPTSGQEMAAFSLGAGGAFSWSYLGMRNVGGVTKFVFRGSSTSSTVVITGTTTVVAGTTYHIAVTFDGVTAKLYVNGLKEAEGAIPTGVFSNGTRYIGALDTGSGYWDGGLDEIIYLGYPLSAARILEISKTTKNIA